MVERKSQLISRPCVAELSADLPKLRTYVWRISIAFWLTEMLIVQIIHSVAGGELDASIILVRLVWLFSGLCVGVLVWKLMTGLHHLTFWKLAASVFLSLGILGSIHAIGNRIFMLTLLDAWPSTEMILPDLFQNTRYWLHFYIAWGATILALLYAMRVRSEEAVRSHVQAIARQAQVQAFRYQINPHFLFNTLNSISTLIVDHQWAKAERLVRALSRHLRRGLSVDWDKDVPLLTEVAHQMEYLDIEKVRLGSRLSVTTEIPETLRNLAVPAQILLPLVENAVSHGVLASKNRTTISISARQSGRWLELKVADDASGSGLPKCQSSQAGGLDFVRGRLAARYGDDYTLTLNSAALKGCVVRLSIPCIEIH
jgi:hypothetical protein